MSEPREPSGQSGGDALCEHGCIEGEPCKVVPCPALRAALSSLFGYGTARQPSAAVCRRCGGTHWTDAEAGGQCINCGLTHPNMAAPDETPCEYARVAGGCPAFCRCLGCPMDGAP